MATKRTYDRPNPNDASDSNLRELAVEELLKRLAVSSDGLNNTEVQQRLRRYGYNEITEKEVSPMLKSLSYFRGPIPIMIIIAPILSAVFKRWPNLGFIPALLVVNAVVGF